MRRLSVVALSLILSLLIGASALAQTPEGTPTEDDLAVSQPETGGPPDESGVPAETRSDETISVPPAVVPPAGLLLLAQPTATPVPVALTGATSGTLEGNRAGSFAYATFYYPKDRTVRRITLNYSPNDVESSIGFGVSIFEVTNRKVTLNGYGSSPGSPAGTSWVDYSSDSYRGTVTVQVFNYNPPSAPPITYSISISAP